MPYDDAVYTTQDDTYYCDGLLFDNNNFKKCQGQETHTRGDLERDLLLVFEQ